MSQPNPPRSRDRRPKMHVLLAIFAVTAVGALTFLASSWYATSGRVAVLETRLQGLSDTLDQRLSAGDWREELAQATTGLEGRIDEQMRSERNRLAAELEALDARVKGFDARVKELAAAFASVPSLEARPSRAGALDSAAGEVATSGGIFEATIDSDAGSGTGAVGSGPAKKDPFEEMFTSMRGSLGLEPARWAEVELELERVLESVWPEYVALSKSHSRAAAADLRRRYCNGVDSVLGAEEAAKLGCGGGG